MNKPPLGDCIPVAEAAEILGVSGVRVTEFCTDGRLGGAFKFSSVWAIPKKSVAAFAKIKRPGAGHVGNPAGRPLQKP